MKKLSREALAVLTQAAQDGQEAPQRLLADLGGDLPVPALLRKIQLLRPVSPD